jgi:hypothetical protein
MIQTRLTDHHAIMAVAAGDDSVFLQQEQAFRQMLQYPPLTSLVRLDVSGTLEPVVAQAAGRWAALLRAEVVSAGTAGDQCRRRFASAAAFHWFRWRDEQHRYPGTVSGTTCHGARSLLLADSGQVSVS